MADVIVVKRTKQRTAARRWLIPIIILAVLIGTFAFLRRRGASATGETTYEFGKVEKGDVVNSVTATGQITPWKIVDVKSNVAGKIDKLTVDLGDPVKAGQLIALIDPTDTQVAVDQAKADLDAAVAKKTQAQVSVVQERAQAHARVVAAERAVQSAKARLAQARASMTVQPKLTASAIAQARASLSSAQKTVAQSQQSKTQLQEQLTQLQSVTIPLNIETVKSNLNQAIANRDSAKADYSRVQSLLAKGYVSKSDVEASFAKLSTLEAAVHTAQQRQQTLDKENQSSIRELQSRIDGAQSSIEEAQARVRQAQASLRLAQDNSFQNEISRDEYNAAFASVKQSEAELASAKAQMNQIEVREKDVQSAQSQVVRGQAGLMQATTNLSYTKINAPRSGVIIAKNVEEGTVVPSSRGSIGSTNALLQIGDVSRLWVVCLVDETDIGNVSVDQKVNVKVDAYPNMIVEGKVIRIDPQAKLDQNVTMIPVTVEIADPDERFKPQMNAECEFIIDQAKNVMTVPNEAVQEGEDGSYSVQKLVDGKPKNFPVEIGVQGPDTTEIKSGLKIGDDVITKTIKPEEAQATNPFGGFGGRPPGGNRGGGRGGGGAGGGARGGGGR
jgi:HlyD family secretion protein